MRYAKPMGSHSALAKRTVVRGATAQPEHPDRSAADPARLSPTTVHVVVELKGAGLAIAVDVVAHRAAALGDRLGERVAHSHHEMGESRTCNPIRRSVRDAACLEPCT